MKKVLMMISFGDFRDEEYFIPKEILQKAGIGVITASTQNGAALGVMGGEAEIDLVLPEVKVEDFDAIVFCGGSGAHKLIDNKNCHRIVQETIRQDKLLGAICIAPAILAKAGVLKGKKATVWSSNLDKSAIKILESQGAIYQSEAVVQDGSIITASGPDVAQDFGQKIVEALTKKS